MSGRTIQIAGRTIQVRNIAQVGSRRHPRAVHQYAWVVAFAAVLFAALSPADPLMFWFAGPSAIAAFFMFRAEKHYVLVVSLNSGRDITLVGNAEQVSTLKQRYIDAMNRPNVVISSSISELAELRRSGMITKQEWEAIKAQVAGLSPSYGQRLVHELEHLGNLRKKGLLSESEFNDRKWSLLSR